MQKRSGCNFAPVNKGMWKKVSPLVAAAIALAFVLFVGQSSPVQAGSDRLSQAGLAKAIAPSPENGAVDIPHHVDFLRWQNGGGAMSYVIFLGTTENLAQRDSRGPFFGEEARVESLEFDQTYFWRVDARNTSGTITGDVWSFRTKAAQPPSKATTPSPQDDSSDVSLQPRIEWRNGGGAMFYDVLLGTTETLTHIATAVAETAYSLPKLAPNQTYRWRVDSVSTEGRTEGDVWTFKTMVMSRPGQATNPFPANGATGILPNRLLSWRYVPGATGYRIYLGVAEPLTDNDFRGRVGIDPETSNGHYSYGAFAPSTTYFWRVDSENDAGFTTGTVWSFTSSSQTLSAAQNLTPANDATNVSVQPRLEWRNGGGATYYEVFLGTSETLRAGDYIAGVMGTAYDAKDLLPHQTYYWRVDAKSSWGTAPGEVWRFTTGSRPAPNKAINPSPANYSLSVAPQTSLQWQNGGGAVGYKVYFGPGQTVTESQYRGYVESAYYSPGIMAPNQVYTWRIDSKNETGVTVGDVWKFQTATVGTPGKATNPTPANYSTSQTLDTKLRWTGAPNTSYYSVYFGPQANLRSSDYRGYAFESVYNPGPLSPESTYFWRIDASNANGTTMGDVWRFSTVPSLLQRTIQVTSPKEGDVLDAGSSHTITWIGAPPPSFAPTNETVSIRMYDVEGLIVSLIADAAPNTGSFSWVVPALTRLSQYQIVIALNGATTVRGASGKFTITPPNQGIVITEPNSASGWLPGTTHSIKWISQSSVGPNVRISLYKGESFKCLIAAEAPNNGNFLWTAPTTLSPGTTYRVRIASVLSPAICCFSQYFQVPAVDSTQTNLAVTYPNASSKWEAGTSNIIKWSPLSAAGPSVRITLYRDGVYKSVLTSNTPNDGSFAWNISSVQSPAASYAIRITSLSNSSWYDLSDQFAIVPRQPRITITDPHIGSACPAGTAKGIKWTSQGEAGALVRITLYKGATLKSVLSASTPNDGSFGWNISPAMAPGQDFRVRITSLAHSSVFDWSDTFAILPKLPAQTIGVFPSDAKRP